MEYRVVTEGSTRLNAPAGGGVSKREEVFYNPHMALNRDVTVALCRLLRPRSFLDAMAGSGARGVRVANEAGTDVVLNDLNPRAVTLIGENAKLNGVAVRVETRDARHLMSGERFDYVDLDPFGPPVAFVDAALASVRIGGVLGVCATDTSALCGTYPRACQRKYDALPLRCDCYDELGLRILLGFIGRAALRFERGIDPLFCHSTRHYMRVQARVHGRHSRTQRDIGYLQYCPDCMWRGYAQLDGLAVLCCCGRRLRTAGPMWMGRFADPELCARLSSALVEGEFGNRAKAVKLADTVRAEQDVTAPYYDLHAMCKRLRVPARSMADAQAAVKSGGGLFARTHFNDTGFRTDLPVGSFAPALK